jgi:hypothetical protein
MANTNQFKVRGEWLVNENDNIVYKPLSFWLDYFGVKPVEGYLGIFKTRENHFIDIQLHGGRMMLWGDREKYLDNLFFVGNADLDRMKIRQAYE